MKLTKEWTIGVPWGEIAAVSWGEPCNPPVLMVHGYLDSAATFIPLLEMLPDSYYYVAFDFPGHGRSDPLPTGLITHGYYIQAMSYVVDYLKWKNFITISHSEGCLLSMLYNNIYTNKIIRMVNIDPAPGFSIYCVSNHHPTWYHHKCCEVYYDSIPRMEEQRTKEFTYEEALSVFTKGRNVNREQTAILISRSLKHVGNGKFRITREPGAKHAVPIEITKDDITEILSISPLPMLNINASSSTSQLGHQIMADLSKSLPFYLVRTVEGAHDLHVTNPEDFVRDIEQFLCREFNKAKL